MRVNRQFYEVPQCLEETHNWPNLQAFIHIIAKRETGGSTSRSERLYLLSKRPTAQEAATLIRGHWQIEGTPCIGRPTW